MHTLPGFTSVPRTGVIYVTTKAHERGFTHEHPEWANLGQGAPEVGQLFAGEQRLTSIAVREDQCEYAPVAGMYELREQIARMYNALYRQGKASQYTAQNVAICSGGRLALTRIAAALGKIHLGHFIPDYTAYEELLNTFERFTPIPLPLSRDGFLPLSALELEEKIVSLGLQAVLLSNPSNPTGQVISGTELSDWLTVARKNACTCIFDEFYSHYVYNQSGPVSATQYIEDVNTDPVIILDGITKNWRYPGLRLSWTVGPVSVIESIASAGSFLDGGASHPLQSAMIPYFEPSIVLENQKVLQQTFMHKRDFTLQKLAGMGISVPTIPQGSFYCFANLQNLPAALRDGIAFFEAGLEQKVITVPGVFFDVNPGKRRNNARFTEFARISFGPSMPVLERGLAALEGVIAAHS